MFGLGKLGKMGRVGGVRTTLASILSKYSGSHLWDFGVPADKVAHRKNLLTYSHDLSNNLAWLKVNSTAPVSATVSPDGTTCYVLTDDATNADHKIRQVVAVAAGTVVTFAAVAKAGTAGYLWLYDGYANSGKSFNLSAQSALAAIGTAPSAFSVSDMGDGWALYVFSYTTSTTVRPEIGISIDGVNNNYVGTGSTVFIDAAGLYAGTYTAQQILDQGGIQRITDYYTEFLAAYPLHHLYQDADGTTPAFLPTHPVGLCLDQPSGSVVLGAEMVTNGGPFTATTGWAASSFGGTLAAVDGELQVTSTDANSRGLFSFATTVGKSYLITGSVRKVSGTVDAAFGYSTSLVSGESFNPLVSTSGSTLVSYRGVYVATATTTLLVVGNNGGTSGDLFAGTGFSVKEVLGSHASQTNPVKRPKLEARYNMLLATATLSTQSVTTLAASYKLTFTGSGTVTLSGTYVGSLVGGGSLTFTATAGTLTLTVTGSVTVADLRPANSPTNLPAYQRVTSATDYDTVGFPLRAVWDGVDDCLVVPTLDLSITDKVTVVAGVTKQSSVLGVVCELTAGSGSAPGSFGLLVPGAVADTQNWRSGGSVPAAGNINSSAITPPASLVLSAQGDIANDVSTLRSNGAEAATSSANQGTGNYSSSALYIGQRSANSVSFTGAIQSITLIPALITASETAVIEASVNNSMGRVY